MANPQLSILVLLVIKLEYGDLSGMKSELQGFRDLSAFRHFEIGVLVLHTFWSSATCQVGVDVDAEYGSGVGRHPLDSM